MAVLRIDIERALDDLVSNEGGMGFQGLAVVLGKMRWPELIAHERHKDRGLDAYAPASLTPEKVIGKGLASSITPTLKKISEDAETAKKNFPDLGSLLFVTTAKVGNADRKRWGEEIQSKYGIEIHILSREEIITSLTMPKNAALCGRFLHLHVVTEPQVADLIERTRRAAAEVTRTWATKTKGHPLVDLSAVRLDLTGAESAEAFSLEEIDKALSESRRIVLEAPAGGGKTTTLIQLAQHARPGGTAFMVDLPAWTASHKGILDYLAGMPSFLQQRVTAADLAGVQASESFLFLLNGWNEIAESSSMQAVGMLRELERAFPAAGIIVATRTHHLTPPLPGALRLRLLRLRRTQRADYLSARLGAKAGELRDHLDAEPVLDELTRTPFILSEVVSLFEAGATIPDTKVGVLAAVIRLQDEGEHRNALQAAPLFGRQKDYLEALATEMTGRGAVALPDADARAIAIAVGKDLVQRNQVAAVPEPMAVLAALTGHHLLDRLDYPETAHRFAHQQFQEYYAALDVRARLLGLRDGDAQRRFMADYVNGPAWAEPLRMIAETLAAASGNAETDKRNVQAGRQLVEMALAVDPIFAAELAQLCGPAVWREVRDPVGKRLRALYAIRDDSYRQCALAAMLATGSDDFKDIVIPLLSATDQQVRLNAYRLWPDIQVTCLGADWREQLRGWSDEARADFASELLHHRLDADIASFAVADPSAAVKQAAASSLAWTRSDDAAARVLESMDAQTFEDVARKNADLMPAALRPKTVAALRKFIETTTDHPARLRAALDLMELGETGLEGVLKDALAALSGGDMRNLGHYYILPALERLRKTEPEWVSEWVAVQVAGGVLYSPDYWMTFATAIPNGVVEKYLQRLETEDLKNARFAGVVAVIAARPNTGLAARVFSRLRELRLKIDAQAEVPHEFERAVTRQLEAVFHHLTGDVAVSGILTAISGEPVDIKVATDLLSRVARSDLAPLQVDDEDLKARLRLYLTGSVDAVLREDDFNGEQKVNLASSIAQVGRPEDMTDLVRLIQADVERVRRGRAARAAGDRGPLGNGGTAGQAPWYLNAVMQLDSARAEQVLIDLLPEREYTSPAAGEMARAFLPQPERTFDTTFRYDLMWAAREGRLPPSADNERRTRYAEALDGEIKRLLKERAGAKSTGPIDYTLKGLANALAAIDGRASAATVLEIMSLPGERDDYSRVDAAERLLVSGVVLPTATAFSLVDSILARTVKWMQDSDKYLLRRILSLCAFVDEPAKGIEKVREVVAKRQLAPYELRELVTALGESRSDAAVDFLGELASDPQTFEQCEDNFINALAALDTPRSRDLLLAFVDPDIRGIPMQKRFRREDVLVARITELAKREPKIATHLRGLCDKDLPELNRHVLSKVMEWMATPDALAASLNLIDDAKRPAVPQGTWDLLESAFVERKPYGDSPNTFIQEARTSNDTRARLFKMVSHDDKRRKAAFSALGQIEKWRLEYGRPAGEPRHPDFESGEPWPPQEPGR